MKRVFIIAIIVMIISAFMCEPIGERLWDNFETNYCQEEVK